MITSREEITHIMGHRHPPEIEDTHYAIAEVEHIATLKAVGEWLSENCSTDNNKCRYHCEACVADLVDSLKRGEMPKGE